MNDKKAVVVDDSPQTSQLIKLVLEMIGFNTIIEASNGVDAIDKLKKFNADVIIMDWIMDEMNGIDCTKAIRSGIDGIDKNIPIILLTGSDVVSIEKQAYVAGADLFMKKPFSMRIFHTNLLKVLK